MAIKLTKEQQQTIAAAVFGVAAFIFCYARFFWMPLSKQTADINAKIESLSKDIEQAQHQAARLPELEKQLVALNEDKIEAEKRLPRNKSVPDILVTLGTLGAKSRVSLMSFTPGGSSAQQYFNELKFPVSARGSFHNIGRFFAALALEQRLYNVFNVNYPEPTGDSGEMQITFQLSSYQYKE